MDRTFWHRQSVEKLLFPELEWSRPENKAFAGKLLIVGGCAQSFAAVADAYGESLKAGVGVARVLLPDALSKTVGSIFPEAEFAPSTPSGGFARKALAEVLAASQWADGVLLAGDFGRNSETAIVLEQLAQKYTGQLTITKDAADYFTKSPLELLNRPNTVFVVSLAQLQQIAMHARFATPITFSIDIIRLADALHELTQQFAAHIIVKHLDTTFVAVDGQVSTTPIPTAEKTWRLKTATHAAVWWLQTPEKPFESLTTSIVS